MLVVGVGAMALSVLLLRVRESQLCLQKDIEMEEERVWKTRGWFACHGPYEEKAYEGVEDAWRPCFDRRLRG